MEILWTENNVTEMKTAFDDLMNRLDIGEERISELEHISTEITHTEKQRERRLKKTKQNKPRREYPRTVG